MAEIIVELRHIEDCRKHISSKFPVVKELLAVVQAFDKREDGFCFEATFPFGENILMKGKSCLLGGNREVATWKDALGERAADEVWTLFQRSCSKNTDHPLSIVCEGEVEVYSGRRVNLTKDKRPLTGISYFPLDHLTKGEWFGVYGANDMIATHDKTNTLRWDGDREWAAVAGRRCVSINVPPPIFSKCPAPYRRWFAEIFPSTPKEYKEIAVDQTEVPDSDQRETLVKGLDEIVYESFCALINDRLKEKAATKVLIIPDHYFLVGRKDSEALRSAKMNLQRRLVIYGWGQSASERDALWKQRAVAESASKVKQASSKMILNHLDDVVGNKGYCLRSVRKGDGTLYEGVKALYELWSDRNLWTHCVPIVLTYARGIPIDGSPALVLSQFLPSNIVMFDDGDVQTLATRAMHIKNAVLDKFKSEGRNGSCTFYTMSSKMLADFWAAEQAARGNEWVGHVIGKDGARTILTLNQVGLKTGEKAKFLMAYFNHAFLLSEKRDV